MIALRGVRAHNLKNVDVDIPRGALVAVCGVSGSGKTSLAIDTLYAEAQRRYIESFSAYTRQFLERLDKPDFDRIDGLTPALAVTRSGASRGNRSTVGTASETLDYLRLLFANLSELYCYKCGQRVVAHNPQTVAEFLASKLGQCKVMVAFQTHWEDIGERAAVLNELQSSGLVRLVAAGKTVNLGQKDREALAEALPKRGRVYVVVDRLRGGDDPTRSTPSLETAFSFGEGVVSLLVEPLDSVSKSPVSVSADRIEVDGQPWEIKTFREQLVCPTCNIEYPAPVPRLFSFNSPLGACPKCEGFGDTVDLDMDLVIPDKNKTLRDNAVAPWSTPAYSHNLDELIAVADRLDIPLNVPIKKFSKKQLNTLQFGDPKRGYEGIVGFFAGLERKKYKMHVRIFIARWRSYNRCSQCNGRRLSELALSYKLAGESIADLCNLPIERLREQLESWRLGDRERTIASIPLEQLVVRLNFLESVGLGYLTLDRTLRTLSGGESQRTALTSALGSSLVNMLYVLDEPSVGLHPHDVERLAIAVQNLAERGNTVVMIEHEEALLERADWFIEVGPKAGASGGEIVFAGTKAQLLRDSTLTGGYLSGKRKVPIPNQRRQATGTVTITKCTGNNLQQIDVVFPLGVLCVVTGVSGSGKSSLVQDTFFKAIANRLQQANEQPLPFDSILGLGLIDDCILVDQSPVSRSPRSNPVTYVKAFDEIRSLFADSMEAKANGLTASHFSFNSDAGRCPKCSGDGVLQIDMQFLADITMVCPDCRGRRYRGEVLRATYRGLNIADVLELTVKEAIAFFRGAAKVQAKLKVLVDVGLEYLQLGQSATTLSSGEAQRLKLAGFLASATKKKTLFILDEPTTGLHTHDIVQLLDCFDALVADGHSLIIVEHNMHLVAAADYVIDLGPGPAEAGGRIVVAGTPEEVAACPDSLTGRYLAAMLTP